jgi:hypothetical protein
VRSPVVKETSEESLIDLDLGARLPRHPGSVSHRRSVAGNCCPRVAIRVSRNPSAGTG